MPFNTDYHKGKESGPAYSDDTWTLFTGLWFLWIWFFFKYYWFNEKISKYNGMEKMFSWQELNIFYFIFNTADEELLILLE